MVLRRSTQPIQTRFLPRLEEPPGVTLPSPPVASPPTLPPAPSGIPGAPRSSLPAPVPVEPRTQGETDLERDYNEFYNGANNEIDQLGRPVVRDGRYFFPSAPLGLEWAGSYVRVPVGQDEETRQYLFDVEFELNPALLPIDRRTQLASGSAGMYAPAGPVDQATLITEERARFELNRLSLEDLNIVKSGLIAIDAMSMDDFGAYNIRDTQSNPRIQEGFNRLVSLAQNNGREWRDLLNEMVVNNQTLAPLDTDRNAGRGVPNVIRLTAPQDLNAVANDVALRTIGRALTDEESQMFITSYQQQERAYQQRLLGGGEVETPPDVGVAARTQIETQFEDEYEMFQMGNVLDQFRAVMAGEL